MLLSKKDLKYLIKKSIELAKKSEMSMKMSSIIIGPKKGILSTGINSRKTHPLQQLYCSTDWKIHLHAEVDSLRKLTEDQRNIYGCLILIIRVKKDGKLGCSNPCYGCRKAILNLSRIETIMYVNENGNLITEQIFKGQFIKHEISFYNVNDLIEE